ncbi:MAG: glycosyltransferase family 2 protein [Candidatus Levyibacteriota bacterium]
MKSKVSIIIPTHNRSQFLMDVLESVSNQTKKPFEVIVVDDGSTDNTREAMLNSGYRAHYIQQENSGPAAARNRGIAAARGNILAFLDDDDLLLPHALELAVRRLENRASFQVGIVFGLIMRIKNVKRVKDKIVYEEIPPVWPERMIGSAIIRKEVFNRVGLFDESLTLGQDIDWYMRAREKHIRFSFLNEITYLYRMHNNNRTNNKHESRKFMLKVLKKSLSRRERAGSGIAQPLLALSDFLY